MRSSGKHDFMTFVLVDDPLFPIGIKSRTRCLILVGPLMTLFVYRPEMGHPPCPGRLSLEKLKYILSCRTKGNQTSENP